MRVFVSKITRILACACALAPLPTLAQFGSGIVFDPTQSAHAAQQIIQGSQLYTTTVQTTRNVISTYNLAQRMASAPQELYTSYYNMGRQNWTSLTQAGNTYGNTGSWMTAAASGNGAVAGSQQTTVSRTPRIAGYGAMSAEAQQAIAAQGATADLNDATNATTLQTLGTVRAAAAQREADIANLERSSHSTDPIQQTELATLQRINQALLLQLRTQQEASQMTQTQSLQQMLAAKQQQDALKMQFQAADGYEANYNSKTNSESAESVRRAFHY